jgi:hypothetical protein
LGGELVVDEVEDQTGFDEKGERALRLQSDGSDLATKRCHHRQAIQTPTRAT